MKRIYVLIFLLTCLLLCGCKSYDDVLLLGHDWGESEDDFYIESGNGYYVTSHGELFGCTATAIDGRFGKTRGLCEIKYQINLGYDEDAQKLVDDMFELLKDETVIQHDVYEKKEFVEWATHNGPGGVTLDRKKMSAGYWEFNIHCWYDKYNY